MSTGRCEVLEGDALERMRELPDNSVHAIVTDPPYGLRIMGRAWDHGVPGEPFWREALRVAVPGAALVAFGGTRTHHRLWCAIEDAGWKIQDGLLWLYGQGFPKSRDISKAIDAGFRSDESGEYQWSPASAPSADVYAVTAFVKAARERSGKSNAEIDAAFGFNGMAGHWTSSASQPAVPTWPQWERLKALLGFSDEMDAMVERINGGKGDRSLENTALARREVVGVHERAAMGQTWRANYGDTADLTPKVVLGDGATEAARAWAGWGTALKPAWEPIVLARKAVIGNIAANVLAYGAGGLNVDGCRIPFNGPEGAWPGDSGKEYAAPGFEGGFSEAGCRNERGRWPANVMLDPEAAGILDEQTRELGGASRFFFCAKPSTGERERGLESLPGRTLARSGGAQSAEASAEDYAAAQGIGLNRVQRVKNHHPTIKPVELMQWLCRLVAPPGGVVLDPFCGSGSTGVAARREGLGFVGVEIDPDFAAIARRRISEDAPLFNRAPVEPDREEVVPDGGGRPHEADAVTGAAHPQHADPIREFKAQVIAAHARAVDEAAAQIPLWTCEP